MKRIQPIVQLSRTAHLLRDGMRTRLAMGFVCLAGGIRLQADPAIQTAGVIYPFSFAALLNSPQGNGISVVHSYRYRSGGCRFSLAAPT